MYSAHLCQSLPKSSNASKNLASSSSVQFLRLLLLGEILGSSPLLKLSLEDFFLLMVLLFESIFDEKAQEESLIDSEKLLM